jgi:hypothetical protein
MVLKIIFGYNTLITDSMVVDHRTYIKCYRKLKTQYKKNVGDNWILLYSDKKCTVFKINNRLAKNVRCCITYSNKKIRS